MGEAATMDTGMVRGEAMTMAGSQCCKFIGPAASPMGARIVSDVATSALVMFHGSALTATSVVLHRRW